MPGKPGRSGGKRISTRPDAGKAGRPRKLISVVNRKPAAVLRDGDAIALHTGAGIIEARVEIRGGVVQLINTAGQSIALTLME